jgi:cyclomaltodextrinase
LQKFIKMKSFTGKIIIALQIALASSVVAQAPKQNAKAPINKAPISKNPNLQKAPTKTDLNSVKHPEWILNSSIYEVNLRQFGKESSFKSFQKELPRLKKLGANILCFMPIQPIGKQDRKGTLGNCYAVQNYKEINPEFGTLDDFKLLVGEAHKLGLKVIIDWVANHTSPDHVWTKKHSDYYVKDSKGKFVHPMADYTDVIDLNYDNKDLRNEMIESMKFWITNYDVDGFRSNLAELVPTDFWVQCRKQLDAVKPVFMLADGEKPALHQAFDMTYATNFYQTIKEIINGDKKRSDLVNYFKNQKSAYSANDLKLYFTSNHLENSGNKNEFEAFGNAHKAFAAMTAVLPGMPMIYGGQEAAQRKHLKPYDKDLIEWGDYEYASFYAQMMKLHHQSRSLLPQSTFEIMDLQNENLFAFKRSYKNEETIFVMNISKSLERLILPQALSGTFTDCSNSNNLTLNQNTELVFEPYQYFILQREKSLPTK